MRTARCLGFSVAAIVTTVIFAGAAAAQMLNRDPAAYCIFAQETVSLKDINVNSACNVGVNCAQPTTHSECGTANFSNPTFANGSQLAGDQTNFSKPGGTLWQLFTNQPFNMANVTINSPPATAFATPIIPGTCDSACNADPSVLEAFCNFPNPFPSCAPGTPVTVKENQDCVGAPDTNPGNGECDLGPGTYGDITVQNDGVLNLSAGDYNVCSVLAGRRTRIRGQSSIVNIPSPGAFKLNNGSRLGQQCDDITVNMKGVGTVNFGRSVTVVANFCAPSAQFNLGDSNSLQGQFIGAQVFGNRNNTVDICRRGQCTCFDSFDPTMAKEGDPVTLMSQCDLTRATAVRVCGINAMITSQTANMLTFVVPAGAAAGSPCTIEVSSATGVYMANDKLTVTP
jgi:hypothetical protein